MKTIVVIFLLAVSLSSGCCLGTRRTPNALAAPPVATYEFKVNRDGTVTVTGVVLENNHGCEVDGRCFLRLQVGGREIVVVYGPAEGEKVTHVRDTPEEWKIKKGDHVKGYGKYSKDNGEIIEVYSSDSYYVHVLAD